MAISDEQRAKYEKVIRESLYLINLQRRYDTKLMRHAARIAFNTLARYEEVHLEDITDTNIFD